LGQTSGSLIFAEAALTNSPILVGNGATRVIALHGWFVDAS
jgi:hypothetical protein